MSFQSLFCGILFCISVAALIIACLAFTNKGGGKGEYYKTEPACVQIPRCLQNTCLKASVKAAYLIGWEDGGGIGSPETPEKGWTAFTSALSYAPGCPPNQNSLS